MTYTLPGPPVFFSGVEERDTLGFKSFTAGIAIALVMSSIIAVPCPTLSWQAPAGATVTYAETLVDDRIVNFYCTSEHPLAYDCIVGNAEDGDLMSSTIDENYQRLSEIGRLSTNWNGYGADPLPEGLIEKARSYISMISLQPEIFPTANDSIQFEYNRENGDYLEFELFDGDKVEVFTARGNGKVSYEDISASIITINRIVEGFYGDGSSTI